MKSSKGRVSLFFLLFLILPLFGCGGGGGGENVATGGGQPPLSALSSITVIPATASIPLGGTQQYIVLGTFTDGTTRDVTTSVAWRSSSENIANITKGSSNKVIANGVALGTINLIATLAIPEGTTLRTGQASLTVIGPAVPSVTLSLGNTAISETSGTTSVTATLSAVSNTNVTVTLTNTGDAFSALDYMMSNTITILAGNLSGMITLSSIADTLDEPNERLIITLTCDTTCSTGNPSVQTVEIIDNSPPPTVTLSVSSSSMSEGTAATAINAKLNFISAFPVTINLNKSGSAMDGIDYNLTGNTITIPAGSLTAGVFLISVNDSLYEGNEFIDITPASVINGVDASVSQRVTIVDDDAPPTVTLSVGNDSITENIGTTSNTSVKLKLNKVSGQNTEITLAKGGIATDIIDYRLSSNSLVIGAGSMEGVVSLTAVDDVMDEIQETVVISIVSVVNGTNASVPQNVFILDNDTTSVTLTVGSSSINEYAGTATTSVTANLNEISSLPVSVALTKSGTAMENSDYTLDNTISIPIGSLQNSIVLTVFTDTLAEMDETIVIDISSVSNGIEFGGNQQQTVTIVSDTTKPVIAFHANMTAEATSAAGAVVIYTSPTTSDAVDGAGVATCTPLSNSTFPIATTTVTCNATDANGNQATSTTFTIMVSDTTKPVIASHSNLIAEATGPTGAVVIYTPPTTSDVVDGAGVATCTPASNTTFAIGTTMITCNATDASGNQATSTTFTITVSDTTKPVIASHSNLTAEATGPTGAVVIYTSPETSDAVDGAGVATCTPLSNSTFPIATTTITCNATDASGNQATSTTFTITVSDTTKPVIASHSNLTAEATSAAGAVVIYTSPATSDAVGGAGVATCTPLSNTTFPIATTTITCNATDANGNTATSTTFTITVSDTTKPVIAFHSNLIAEATSAAGAVVIYTSPTTSDAVDGAGVATCTPLSNSTFAIGTTTVTCNATDASGNTATSTTFTITVRYITVTLSVGIVSIPETSGTTTVTATLSDIASLDVTVTLNTSGTAYTTDYTLTNDIIILAGELSSSIVLSAADDALYESNETVIISIIDVINAIDDSFPQTVTIMDDDPIPSVSLSVGSTLIEGNTVMTAATTTVTAILNTISGQTVTVTLVMNGGTAIPDDDFTLNGTIVIPEGSLFGVAILATLGDTNAEPDETVVIDITLVTNAIQDGNQQQTVLIVNDDAPSAPTLSPIAFGTKVLNFNWAPIQGATYYKLFEDADGSSTGVTYQQVGPDITSTSTLLEIAVHTQDWNNAQYRLQACNLGGGCSADSSPVSASLLAAVNTIGYFKASNPTTSAQFGYSVSVSGDGNTMAVGAPLADGMSTGSGVVYIFTQDSNSLTWSQQSLPINGSNDTGDQFGFSVALSDDGNTLVVGAHFEDSNATSVCYSNCGTDNSALSAGAAYIFTRSSGVWIQSAYLKGSNNEAGDRFGSAVTISGDGLRIAVAAPLEDSNASGVSGTIPTLPDNDSASSSGAVHIFIKSLMDGSWSQEAYVKAFSPGGMPSDDFGSGLSLDKTGTILVVGGSSVDVAPFTNNGAAYTYKRSGGTWTIQSKLMSASAGAATSDQFGYSVAISDDGSTLAVGMNSTTGTATGNVSIFTGIDFLTSTSVVASNAQAEDRFGIAIALNDNGTLLAVGATREDGSGTGIDPASNEGATNAGAAYIFTNNSGAWSQSRYLKASNTGASDNFGGSVSLSNQPSPFGTDYKLSTLIVGASSEDGSNSGINPPFNDISNGNFGAVYPY